MEPMDNLHWLLLGYGLGVLPGVRAARIFTAFLAKRMGIKPKQIEEYDEATTEGSE